MNKKPQLVTVIALCTLVAAAGGSLQAQTGPPDLSAEIWIAPGSQLATTGIGDWATTGSGDTSFSFGVPADFDQLTAAKVVVIGKKNADATYDLSLSWVMNGAGPQDGLTNVLLDQGPVSLLKDEVVEIDVTAVFAPFAAGLAPEDDLSLSFSVDPNGHARVVGMRFQYAGRAELAGLECPENSVLYGYDDEGNLLCRDGCVDGEVLVGWDAAGDPICLPDNQACAENQVMVGFDLAGSPLCIPDNQACPAESVMVGFDLDGSPICKPDSQACGDEEVMVGFDLNGSPLCKPDAQACEDDEVMVGFDLNGSPICRPGGAACLPECFGGGDGSNDGEQCSDDSDCFGGGGTGRCQNTALVGFALGGTPDCRTLAELGLPPATGTFNIQLANVGEEGTSGDPTAFTEFVFAVSRTPILAAGEEDTVNFTTQDGSATGGASCADADVDYITQTDSLTFTDADCTFLGCSKEITVSVCPDSRVESDETFDVVLSLPFGSTSSIGNGTGTGTILDDDTDVSTFSLRVIVDKPPLVGAQVLVNGSFLCFDDCLYVFPADDMVSLFAESTDGRSNFVNWTGDDECDGSTDNPLTVVMDADKECTAVFQ